MSRILYIDCFSGIAGDMMLGALLHLGVPIEVVRGAVSGLDLEGWEIRAETGEVGGITGVDVHVFVGGLQEITPHHAGSEGHSDEHGHSDGHSDEHGHGHGHGHGHEHGHGHGHGHEHGHGHGHSADEGHEHPHSHEPSHSHGRTWAEILRILERGRLDERVRSIAIDAFGRLAVAEGRIHGIAPEDVHFHEVGAVDAIVDIVGSAAGLVWLGVDEVRSAPPPMTRGFVRCAHGRFPLPAPATLELLIGVAVQGDPGTAELVTPTGAALLRAMASSFGGYPEMIVDRTGYGLGDARWADRPNVLRLVLGHVDAGDEGPELRIEANIDDMSPELFAPLLEGLLADGAHDAWLVPIHMKKGRPGIQLCVLAPAARRAAMVQRIVRDSTSIGVRMHPVHRVRLERRTVTVETPWGPVRVKHAYDGEQLVNSAPEFEDCNRLAREHGAPLRAIYEAALALAPRPDPVA